MTVSLTFLGAVGTVTGSKYLLEAAGKKILIDCGLFQGFKQLRLRNWSPPPVDPGSVDEVVLTHAHIDHSGYLPLFVRNGFRGKVYCTPPTRDLCKILLTDSGHLQERDAEFANKHGFSKHRPALPLYTAEDAEKSLKHFRPVDFERTFELTQALSIRFLPAGHILGAACVLVNIDGVSVLFSGDLGRSGSPTMHEPATVKQADYLIVESTYGDRRHDPADPEDKLAEIIVRTAERGGTILIPAFAVGRTQELLYHLHRLKAQNRIPDIPVFLDSPMAINATDVFCRHVDAHKLSSGECREAFGVARYVQSVEESKAVDRDTMPKIIVSASGMATGGRVLHHLKHFATDGRNTVLFAGYQAGGTRGAAMTAGAQNVKIHGAYIPIKAEVDNLSMLSAHADCDEIMAWLGGFSAPPRMTFITHGEPPAADALRHRIEEELGWPCRVPDYKDTAELG
ncbi:MAG: MBL fold metallo-hydrolase [Rhodospirillales bacterium]